MFISVLLVLCFVGLIRNERVYKFKIELNDAVSEYQKERIKDHGDLDYEAYRLYDRVGYHKPVIMFWRRLDSFVPQELKKKLGE